MNTGLAEAMDQLLDDVAARASASPDASYTAKLLQAGPAACAKKLGEEGVELALAVAAGTEDDVANEAADLLFHLAVALQSRQISPSAIARVLGARRGVSGLTEKANRTKN